MTNSRLTDPEISRPASRCGSSASPSAAARAARPGTAATACAPVRFLEPMRAPSCPTAAGCRRAASRAAATRARGQQVVRADGAIELLCATASVEMEAGDLFVIETPGGGGYGAA